MPTCITCFAVADMRTEGTCKVCEKPLHKDCAIKEDGVFYCDGCYTVRTETPEKVEFQIPDVIRRTYIELYRTCPHKFFKEVIEGNNQPPTCYTQIGIDLHDLFEKAINDRSYTEEQMRDAYSKIWDAYDDALFDSPDQKNDMEKRSDDSITTFYKVISTLPIPIITEETIHFSIGDDLPLVEFTMDAVLEVDGKIELLDWKTGGVMVGQKISSDLQAPLYLYGVIQHLKRPVEKFTFYYVKDGKERVFHRIDDDTYHCTVGKRVYKISLLDAIREVKTIFSHIKAGRFGIPQDTRKMYFSCKMCHIKKQGQCRGADEEAWYLK